MLIIALLTLISPGIGGRNKSQRGSRIMGVVGGWPHDILEARNDNYNTTQFIYTYQTMIARLPYKP